jgi:hypothetical protein
MNLYSVWISLILLQVRYFADAIKHIDYSDAISTVDRYIDVLTERLQKFGKNGPSFIEKGKDGTERCCLNGQNGPVCVDKGLPLLFHANELGERGVEVAIFDYAHSWEDLLCGVSYIAVQGPGSSHPAKSKFEARFGDRLYMYSDPDFPEINAFVEERGIVALYAQIAGTPDGIRFSLDSCTKLLIHCVFYADSKFGDVYSVISEALPNEGNHPIVPYMIRFPSVYHGEPQGMRKELNIPTDATVFCRHGGKDTFNLMFVQASICEMLILNSIQNIYFVFVNTNTLPCVHSNIIYLPTIVDVDSKRKFLETCDACVHARQYGETFGLAIAECSTSGLPVITYLNSPDRMHLLILQSHALTYTDQFSFSHHIREFDVNLHRSKKDVYKHMYDKYTPENVMATFAKVFGLDSLHLRASNKDCTFLH